jgi:hypothetical protein
MLPSNGVRLRQMPLIRASQLASPVLGGASVAVHMPWMQIPDLLALRRAATEDRLTQQAAERSARRANPASYPITLSYRYLTPQQQQERCETAEDVLRCIETWLPTRLLSERQKAILRALASKLQASRGTCAISPWEWEQFWMIRDYMMPDP